MSVVQTFLRGLTTNPIVSFNAAPTVGNRLVIISGGRKSNTAVTISNGNWQQRAIATDTTSNERHLAIHDFIVPVGWMGGNEFQVFWTGENQDSWAVGIELTEGADYEFIQSSIATDDGPLAVKSISTLQQVPAGDVLIITGSSTRGDTGADTWGNSTILFDYDEPGAIPANMSAGTGSYRSMTAQPEQMYSDTLIQTTARITSMAMVAWVKPAGVTAEEKAGTDNASLSTSESSSLIIEDSKDLNDTGTLSATESLHLEKHVVATDQTALASLETSNLFAEKAATDAGTLSASDSSGLTQGREVNAFDSGSLSATESAAREVSGDFERAGNDSATLVVTSSASVETSIDRSDTSILSTVEESSLDINRFSELSDETAMSIVESSGITIVRDIDVGDTVALFATEAAVVAEPSRIVKVRIGGAWVAGTLKVFINGEWQEKPLRIYRGGDWT